MKTSSFDLMSDITAEMDKQIHEELVSLSAPVGAGELDAIQWCLDTSMTRCIPISICIEHLRAAYGIDVNIPCPLDRDRHLH